MNMTRDAASKALALRDNILAMFETKEYKTVLEEGYFKDEAMRLPLALVDNEMQDEVDQRIIKEQIAGIGHLHVWLNSRIALGNQVQASLDQEEKERVDATKAVDYDDVTGDPIVMEEV